MSSSSETGSGSEDGEVLDPSELADLLHSACIAGDVESVTSLLTFLDLTSASIANSQGATPLHSAAFNGHLDCVRALVDANIDIDAAEERGSTPLFLAAQCGHESVVRYLVKQNANVARPCALGSTPLMAAVQNGWPKVVRVLVGSESNTQEKEEEDDKEEEKEEERQARNNAANGDLAQLDGGTAIAELPSAFVEQAQHMPLPLRRLIVCGAAPSEVTAAAVVHALRLPLSQFRSAVAALAPSSSGSAVGCSSLLLRQPDVLDAFTCARLREAVNTSAATNADSVDGLADHQMDFKSLAELEVLIGSEALQRLQRLPEAFYAATSPGSACATRLVVSQTFIRRYACYERPWFGFHRDTGPLTVNVALADDACHRGGRLLGVMEGAVQEIERREGEATIHPSTLLHGVSRMLSGGMSDARFSLIVFYRERDLRRGE